MASVKVTFPEAGVWRVTSDDYCWNRWENKGFSDEVHASEQYLTINKLSVKTLLKSADAQSYGLWYSIPKHSLLLTDEEVRCPSNVGRPLTTTKLKDVNLSENFYCNQCFASMSRDAQKQTLDTRPEPTTLDLWSRHNATYDSSQCAQQKHVVTVKWLKMYSLSTWNSRKHPWKVVVECHIELTGVLCFCIMRAFESVLPGMWEEL